MNKTSDGWNCEVWPGENHNYCRERGRERGRSETGKNRLWCNVKRYFRSWKPCFVRDCNYCDVGNSTNILIILLLYEGICDIIIFA